MYNIHYNAYICALIRPGTISRPRCTSASHLSFFFCLLVFASFDWVGGKFHSAQALLLILLRVSFLVILGEPAIVLRIKLESGACGANTTGSVS